MHGGSGTHGSGSGSPGYETRDTRLRVGVWLGVGLAVLVVGAFVAMKVLFDRLAASEAGSQAAPLSQTADQEAEPPAPRLQTTAVADLREARRQEEALLHSYGWSDPEAGTVRLPIERAVERVLRDGLPAKVIAPGPAGAGEPPAAAGAEGRR